MEGETMTYTFIEHTSDIIIQATNKTFEMALEDIASGMFTQMASNSIKEKDSFVVTVTAPNREELVVNLFSEVIMECETIPFAPRSMKITLFKEKNAKVSVTAKVYGEKKLSENIIKAVTYHGLKVEKKQSEWLVEVLFDI
jgi:SHS2 domain-containing protein